MVDILDNFRLVFKLLNIDVDNSFYIYISYIIKKLCLLNFNKLRNIPICKLLKIQLSLPVNEKDEIDYEYIESLF